MSYDEQDRPLLDRRQMVQGVMGLGALGALAATLPASAQNASAQNASAQSAPPPGVARPRIAMMVHPNMVLQDLVGPLTVFNVMMSEIHLVWKDLNPVTSEVRIPVTPTTTFADCPRDLDVLFVPGGLAGTIPLMNDPEVINFLIDRARTAKYVTSVCTGGLLLGAAGLLKGYRATSFWPVRHLLATMGATVVHERVVEDRNRFTAGGATAGVDFGLTIAAKIRGVEGAKRIQLTLEYDPQPPFDAGSPEKAGPSLVEPMLKMRAPAIEKAREAAETAAKRLQI
jgi:cyclohexyl-isocyanide hydratase